MPLISVPLISENETGPVDTLSVVTVLVTDVIGLPAVSRTLTVTSCVFPISTSMGLKIAWLNLGLFFVDIL